MTVPFEADVVTYEVRDSVAVVTLNRPTTATPRTRWSRTPSTRHSSAPSKTTT